MIVHYSASVWNEIHTHKPKKSLRRRGIYLFLPIRYEKYSIFEGQTLNISQNIITLKTETALHTCKNKKGNKEKRISTKKEDKIKKRKDI